MKIKDLIKLRDCYSTMCDIILQENGGDYNSDRDLGSIKLGNVAFVLNELDSKCVVCEKCKGTGNFDIAPDSIFKEGCTIECPDCNGSGGYFREYDINIYFN